MLPIVQLHVEVYVYFIPATDIVAKAHKIVSLQYVYKIIDNIMYKFH